MEFEKSGAGVIDFSGGYLGESAVPQPIQQPHANDSRQESTPGDEKTSTHSRGEAEIDLSGLSRKERQEWKRTGKLPERMERPRSEVREREHFDLSRLNAEEYAEYRRTGALPEKSEIELLEEETGTDARSERIRNSAAEIEDSDEAEGEIENEDDEHKPDDRVWTQPLSAAEKQRLNQRVTAHIGKAVTTLFNHQHAAQIDAGVGEIVAAARTNPAIWNDIRLALTSKPASTSPETPATLKQRVAQLAEDRRDLVLGLSVAAVACIVIATSCRLKFRCPTQNSENKSVTFSIDMYERRIIPRNAQPVTGIGTLFSAPVSRTAKNSVITA